MSLAAFITSRGEIYKNSAITIRQSHKGCGLSLNQNALKFCMREMRIARVEHPVYQVYP